MTNKIYIQCGYENKCKNKDCLNCPRKSWKTLNLSLAEMIVIENFGNIDLEEMNKTKKKKLELMQKVMFKLMEKVFK